MAALKNHCVILNPTANRGKAATWIPEMEFWTKPTALAIARGPGDATTLAEKAISDGMETIVAAGGDGTINEVINGIRDAPCRLGILPVGTVNVFAKELGLPCHDIKACWDVIARGTTQSVDLFRANERLFVQMAGAGLDAKAIAHTSKRLKRSLGWFGYVWKALTLLRQPLPPIKIVTTDGEDSGCSILIGNGRYYGGSIPLFSKASHQDGLLDVVILRSLRLRDTLHLLKEYLRSFPWSEHPGIRYLQTPWLKITSSEPVDIEVDGEWVGLTPLIVEPFPVPLRVHC